jgi:enoyl-CoA hydratase/carnithine racemase
MDYQTILYEKADPVATIRLNRPEILNPISDVVLRELEDAFIKIREDPGIRIMVITGNGRAFSVGADFEMLTAMAKAKDRPGDDIRWSPRLGMRVMETLERLEQITIAAINGFAVGGGLALPLACDFRIAAQEATFWIPEVDLGVPLSWESIPRLIRLIGPSKTKELIITCDRFGAEEALTLGLVNKVVPLEKLEEATKEMVDKIAKKPPLAVSFTKATVNAVQSGALGQVSYCDPEFFKISVDSPDMQKALGEFFAKEEQRRKSES